MYELAQTLTDERRDLATWSSLLTTISMLRLFRSLFSRSTTTSPPLRVLFHPVRQSFRNLGISQ